MTWLLVAANCAAAQTVKFSPSTMAKIGAVDERFQSYNIEMLEVTGGRFWKPYASIGKSAAPAAKPGATPAGMSPDLYEYRAPIDLANVRLRNLAKALGLVYVRVSGTWANSVYFHDSDEAAPETPPAGFGGVLTRKQWKSVIDFVGAVDGKIVTSFATSVGTRDAAGLWTPEQAKRFVDFTKASGGSIAAAEFMNEPNFAALGGAPKGYDAAAYARDIGVFKGFLRETSPGTVFLGPSAVGEGGVLAGAPMPGRLSSVDLLKATGPVYDAFSYHIYAAVSQRCAAPGGPAAAAGTTAGAALSDEWLGRQGKINAFYKDLRDRFEPGKALWVTETADAACGGNPWAATFLDTFRYLDQHGRLAREGVQVIAHNTLAASDYGLLEEKTYRPRPNYWAAVLWRRLMGPVVLDAGEAKAEGLHVYAQCMAGHPGGVAVLAINAGAAAVELEAPMAGERYTLSAAKLEGSEVELNGRVLRAGADGVLPDMAGVKVKKGLVELAPRSVTFLAFAGAGNGGCR